MRSDFLAALREEGTRLGLSSLGIVRPDPTLHLPFYEEWLSQGHHGEMGYLAREDAVARRGDLRLTMAEVRSVVVVTQEYFQEDPPGVPEDPSRGVIARYARGRDYHRVLKKRLQNLLAWIREEAPGPGGGGEVRGAAYVDTGPILERDLARRAGLGWFGKNTMLIHPRKGSYFFLGLLLLDLEIPPSRPFVADRCGSCTACLDACPTGALLGRNEDGAPVLDARRCISYLTIELKGPIPTELRSGMGNRIFGCDICQKVCPWNVKFARVAVEADYVARKARDATWDTEDVSAETSEEDDAAALAASGTTSDDDPTPFDAGPTGTTIPTTDGPVLIDLMRMSQDEWDAFTRGSPIRRTGISGLRRNVAIALGNWLSNSDTHDPEALGELVAASSDEDPVVAEAAAWALRQAREASQPRMPE